MGNRKYPRSPPQGPTAANRSSSFAARAFEQFGAGLYRYLLSSLRHREMAEDLAQEVYLRLLRFADHKLVQSPEDYLYRVALNVLQEFKLHERRRQQLLFDSEVVDALGEHVPADEESAEELSDLRSQERLLEAALRQLPNVQRAVFLLAVRQDMAHEDIAAKLGLSLHTVRKYLYRAMLHCRRQLSRGTETGVL